MSREEEIQDELEKYWGQLDRVEKMLKWLCIMEKAILHDSWLTEDDATRIKHYSKNLPDISDILEEK